MNKTNQARLRGLTIIELLVAAAAACIVVLAAGIILVSGQRSWDQGLRQANLQRDASYAMLTMKQSINSGIAAVVDDDYYGVKVFRSGGWIRYRYNPGQHDLMFQVQDQEEQVLLDNIVQDASFDLDPNTPKIVIIDLQLEKQNSHARISSKTLMRNFGS